MLDAPSVIDDYYLNLLSFSPNGNDNLAVGLKNRVYARMRKNGVQTICQIARSNDLITSVAWGDSYIALASRDQVSLFDPNAEKVLATYK